MVGEHHSCSKSCYVTDYQRAIQWRNGKVHIHPVTMRITAPVKAHPIGLIRIRDLQTEVQLELVSSQLVGTKMGL